MTNNGACSSSDGASHPTRVRGLKCTIQNITVTNIQSHPTWVRGLKSRSETRWTETLKSHPTRVRELKLCTILPYFISLYVAALPCSAKIETIGYVISKETAPLVEAVFLLSFGCLPSDRQTDLFELGTHKLEKKKYS